MVKSVYGALPEFDDVVDKRVKGALYSSPSDPIRWIPTVIVQAKLLLQHVVNGQLTETVALFGEGWEGLVDNIVSLELLLTKQQPKGERKEVRPN